jgi:putative ABC transport system permease protein
VAKPEERSRVTDMRVFFSRLRALFHRADDDRELDVEVREHIRLLAEENIRRGMRPDEAFRAASIRFGGVSVIKENQRDHRGIRFVESLWQDVRYGIRVLAKSPGFSTLAIIALSLGIGASTAIFSFTNSVLLNPFPYAGSSRLVMMEIHDADRSDRGGRPDYSADEFLTIEKQNHVFDLMIGSVQTEILYSHDGGTDRLRGVAMTPNSFVDLGIPAMIGRGILPSDGDPDAARVFVLRYRTWVREFNSDANLIGKTFNLNGTPRTLVGIMPPRFGWYDSDIWMPASLHANAPDERSRPAWEWSLVGRLKPGVSARQAAADINVIAHQLSKTYPGYPKNFNVQIESLIDVAVGDLRSSLFIILAAVGLLLLIGCANVANLLLARSTVREKEFSVRAALGASRLRLIRQLLVEGFLLAFLGAVCGSVIAWGGLKLLANGLPGDIVPVEASIRINGPALLFALFAAIGTAILFSLGPALQISQRRLDYSLRDSGKGTSGGFHGRRLRDTLVVFEIALSLTLLIGAGLLIRSFVALRQINLGLQPDHVLVISTPLPPDRYRTAAQVQGFFQPLLARLHALPGVVQATTSSAVRPYPGGPMRIEIPGKVHTEPWSAASDFCSEGYFSVLRIPLLRGRTFSEADINLASKVAVVNETFAHEYLPNEDPVGKRIELASLRNFPIPVSDPYFEIVGVVADVKNQGPDRPAIAEVWAPYTITGFVRRNLLIRTAQDPNALLESVRRAISATDSNVASNENATLEYVINVNSYAQARFQLVVMIVFASVGLTLVTIGVYSVIAYVTARRTHEIGIRMALGARPADVLRLILFQGCRLALVGIAVGLFASYGLARFLTGMLYGVKPADPATYIGVALLLLSVTIAACWIPARRAIRVDPTVALRYE